VTLDGRISTTTTASDLYRFVLDALQEQVATDETAQLKLLMKGKRIDPTADSIVFPSIPTKTPKILVMATSAVVVQEMAHKRSDPTIRGFNSQELERNGKKPIEAQHWGPSMSQQNKACKFCRFQACTWQSFGHRPTEDTPHAFRALQLLHKLATDPGIVAVMVERELVVGTLGEMDPIDDRLMQQQQQHGGCVLGYNTNGGARIDVKLRTDDLQGFRPYPELVATLLHELSHNWVGDHNLLFWTNYAQMRAEYLYTHASLRSTIIEGKTTAEVAGLDDNNNTQVRLENIYDCILQELVREMAQHGLHPQMIAAPIRQRCDELEQSAKNKGRRLGGEENNTGGTSSHSGGSARERALRAAERRAWEQEQQPEQNHDKDQDKE
jgi:hypothetical protein